jgi:O-acetyl-ADP-ribose deacetylase
MDILELKSRIELRLGDITLVEADAIVNAANTDLILGAGVSGAIGRGGGAALQEECDKIGCVRLGDAVVTSAGGLRAKYVIHAASMEIGRFATDRDIARATRSALERAEELGLRTIAFPAIGTGVAAFPVDRCAQLMLEEIAQHLVRTRCIEKVILVLLKDEMMAEFRPVFESMEWPSGPGKPFIPSRREAADEEEQPAAPGEGREPGEPREARQPRDRREPGESREPRGQRERRDGRDQRDRREPREQRDRRDPRGPRESRDARGPREQRESRDQREPRDQREARDQREPREAHEPRDPRGPRDPRDRRDGGDPRGPRGQRDPREQRPFGAEGTKQ